MQFRRVRLSAGLVLALLCIRPAFALQITGAGATFPYAVYTKWAEEYKKATGTIVNYQGIGSSGGIKQIKAKTVDFAGTDAPLGADELRQEDLIQFPALMGGVTLVVNLPGVQSGQLKLDGGVAADIFRGAITRWADPAITRLNPGLPLPDSAIVLVYRSDGSGTTHVFTHYLAKQSAAFKRHVGAGKSVNWPDNGVGGKGNPGVAANVGKIRGAIGYVDMSDALKARMKFVALRNRAGQFVLPSPQSVLAAAEGTDFRVPGMAPELLDQGQQEAWPITAVTYVLAHAQGGDARRQQAVADFISWSLRHGQAEARKMGFVPLPDAVTKRVEAEMRRIR